MDRLTKRLEDGGAAYYLDGFGSFDEIEALEECVDKLAAYEDTRLDPEEYKKHADALKKLDIEHMHDLLCAENDGRLVVLPCKVGDMVWTNFSMSGLYFRDKDKPYSVRVVFIGLNGSDAMGKGLINVVYEKHNYMMQFHLSDIGKTVFLTREEAESALKKREEVDNETVR